MNHKNAETYSLKVNFCIYQHLFLFLFFCNAFHFYQQPGLHTLASKVICGI